MEKHDGKVAVVTGGSSGIGFAAAKRLADEGAFVYITGRNREQLDKAATIIGKNAAAVQGDVCKFEDLDRLYALIQREKGHINILFANVGFGAYVPIEQITEKDYDSTFNLNVKAVLFTVQKALPIFKDGGSIIINASTAASKWNPAFSLYGATKAAVRSFARSWAMDLKDRKIRVNAVSPGPINTSAHERSVGDTGNVEELKKHFASIIPMGRMGEPEEVASAVSFLASDESSFITGTELFVDGGQAQV
ncbi:MAG: glucose 1-dehydrogenase [Tannerellaceae bacterium]|jgi:NAD(P)-dependent dehydrogenase (short-subunit alcohol dehydrogenase family)|nr:glucose 1-dehydrogenase [Tannerellaceae bacterium]